MSYKDLIKNKMKKTAAIDAADSSLMKEETTGPDLLRALFKKYKKNFEAHKLLASNPNSPEDVMEKLRNSVSFMVKEIANRNSGTPTEQPSKVSKPTPTFTPSETPSTEYKPEKDTDPELSFRTNDGDIIGLKFERYRTGQPALFLHQKQEDEEWDVVKKPMRLTIPINDEDAPDDIFVIRTQLKNLVDEIFQQGWFEDITNQVELKNPPDIFNPPYIWRLKKK